MIMMAWQMAIVMDNNNGRRGMFGSGVIFTHCFIYGKRGSWGIIGMNALFDPALPLLDLASRSWLSGNWKNLFLAVHTQWKETEPQLQST